MSTLQKFQTANIIHDRFTELAEKADRRVRSIQMIGSPIAGIVAAVIAWFIWGDYVAVFFAFGIGLAGFALILLFGYEIRSEYENAAAAAYSRSSKLRRTLIEEAVGGKLLECDPIILGAPPQRVVVQQGDVAREGYARVTCEGEAEWIPLEVAAGQPR